MDDSFSSLEICKLLRLQRGRLREWIEKEFITPSIEKSKGQGSKNLFSRSDLYGIALFNRLLAMGFIREKAKDVFEGWQSFMKGKSNQEVHEYQFLILPYKLQPPDRKIISLKPTLLKFKFLKRKEVTEKLEISAHSYDQILIFNLETILNDIDERL